MCLSLKIKKLKLFNYRNHKFLSVNTNKKFVFFYGSNGSGKTNILEAVSLLNSNSGFRNAKFPSIVCNEDTQNFKGFGVNLEISSGNEDFNVGIGLEKKSYGLRRFNKINGITKKMLIKNSIKIFWLLPSMSYLFQKQSFERRNFFDSMIFVLDPSHKKRLKLYENLQQQRIQILKKFNLTKLNEEWLDILEKKMSEVGMVICEQRLNFTKSLNGFLLKNTSFPKIKIFLSGQIEASLKSLPALKIEENFSDKLKNNRQIDSKIGKTQSSAIKTNFNIFNFDKNLYAENCSTGEQKVILVSILLSFIEMLKEFNQNSIIFLLDDIFSNLDLKFTYIILEAIKKLNTQTWITDTNREVIKKDSMIYKDTIFINVEDKM